MRRSGASFWRSVHACVMMTAAALVEKQGQFMRSDGRLWIELDGQSSLEVLPSDSPEVAAEAWTSVSVWPAGAMLALHLWQDERYHNKSLRVLELACGGSALPGTAMALKGSNVTFADLPSVLGHTRKTVSHNLRQAVTSGSVAFEAFRWSEPAFAPSFDLVFGSDIVFSPTHVEPIVRWIIALRAETIIAGEDRLGLMTTLQEAVVAGGLEISQLPLPKLYSKTGHTRNALMLMRVRPIVS